MSIKLNTIYTEDCRETMRRMPDNFVNCVVTSPPYWGLRDYGHDQQIGLESTPDEYVAQMVDVFAEVYRVLRDDGTVWLNLGDSYVATGGDYKNGSQGHNSVVGKTSPQSCPEKGRVERSKAINLPSKNLVGMPWRVAFALQEFGWYLRQDIIWNKPNPMPESVEDRCTKSHEYVFLLSKSAKYYFDHEAIKEPKAYSTLTDTRTNENGKRRNRNYPGAQQNNGGTNLGGPDGNRNKRSVWKITLKPFADAHFATFPIELPSLCILAGTSEHGCCANCGTPWQRIIKKEKMEIRRSNRQNKMGKFGKTQSSGTMLKPATSQTIGWQQMCDCDEFEITPAIVYDPFMGAGTTALAALKYSRYFIGSEINPDFCAIADKRILPHLQQPLFHFTA